MGQSKAPRQVQVWSSPSEDAASSVDTAAAAPPPPVLNGKRVLPYKIMMGGISKDRRLPAVFATLDSSYRRGSDGWSAVTSVGVSQDLATTLRGLHESDATEMKVSHVRALSFTFPQPTAMQEVAQDWRQQAREAGATLDEVWADNVLNYLYDEEDDDEDEDEFLEMTADAMSVVASSSSSIGVTTPIVSPFDSSSPSSADEKIRDNADVADDSVPLEFNAENVDIVLNEVRPYLIADGGNVKVERVDTEEQLVELKLEGACGSCASSTVTMQMGIERVLKEKWVGVTVSQVEEEDGKPTELTWEEVENEVGRLKQALIAMGAVVELKAVDSETGTVTIRFRGADRVRQGLELAILDVAFVEQVTFVDEDD